MPNRWLKEAPTIRVQDIALVSEANHEGKVPVHGGGKFKCDTVQIKNDHVPKSKPRLSVGLPDCVQCWEDVSARTSSGRKIKRRV